MKEHLKSAVYTFLSAFILAIVPALGSNDLFGATWKSAIVALLLSALRAGVKAVGENLVVKPQE